MARAATRSDVFNAVGDVHRRDILDLLITREKAVGAIVDSLSIPQPRVSNHLRVLTDVGLVRCRAEGRRRLYRLAPEKLRPLHDWVSKYEQDQVLPSAARSMSMTGMRPCLGPAGFLRRSPSGPRGEFGVVTNIVERVAGHPPVALDAFLAAHPEALPD